MSTLSKTTSTGKLGPLGWATLVLLLIAVTVINAIPRKSYRALESRVAQLQSEQKELKAELRKIEQSRYTVQRQRKERIDQDAKLTRMMRDSTSRDDFIVREGEQIAWSSLNDDEEALDIAIYLPEGRHRLCYALAQPRQANADEREQLQAGVVKQLQEPTRLELGPQAEVYELEVQMHRGDGQAQVVVRGAENKVLHEQPLRADGEFSRGFINLPVSTIEFPSEVSVPELQVSLSGKAALRSATDVAMISLESAHSLTLAELHLWVESDAPACMSAIEVAARYNELTAYAATGSRSAPTLTPEQGEIHFRKLFQPYEAGPVIYLQTDAVQRLASVDE